MYYYMKNQLHLNQLPKTFNLYTIDLDKIL